MLAVVQPYSPDVHHRQQRSTSRSLTHSNLASNHPPSLPRHNTAPLKVPTTPPPPPSPDPETPFDIISYPPSDLLKLLANILTHIATTNDHLSPSASSSSHHTPAPPPPPDPITAPPIWHSLTTAARNAISTPAATLTFHARNIPTISLEAYLLRILKYCPTSNHVFLSLLVYFDRMSKLSQESVGRSFIIDSYNIHRLVIAGITVASKFFSDVFYTNSRYAKVGGLPLHELNQLELQFLLLNDFRLVVSSPDMQDYAEQLILFSKTSPPPSAPNLRLPSITPHTQPPAASSSASTSASSSLHSKNPVPPPSTSTSNHVHTTSSHPHAHLHSHSHLHTHPASSHHSQSHHATLHLPNGSGAAHSLLSHPNAKSDPSSSSKLPIPTPSSTLSSSALGSSGASSSTATPGSAHTSVYSEPPSSSSSGSKTVVGGSRTPTFASAAVSTPPLASSSTSPVINRPRQDSTPSRRRSHGESHTHGQRQRQGSFHAYPTTSEEDLSSGADTDADADDANETETETETETEAETEAESETNTSSSASTDDEPTIRGPRTVYGGGGSVWGDADHKMGSP